MKVIKMLLAVLIITFTANSCESLGLFGYGGVKGSDAKKEILSIANQNNIIILAAYGNALGSYGGTAVVLSILIDGAVVPGLAGISDSKHYSRPSVNACKSKMSSIGLIINNWVGAITCDLKTTPMLLQIGDGDTGNVLQLGPIGL